MFENVMQTRAAICGAGVLVGLVFVLAHLPLLTLLIPVAILFLGIVADPEETRTFCWGVLHAIGLFDLVDLTNTEKDVDLAEYRTWFGLGEVCMAGLLAGIIAIPAGCWFAGRTELSLAVIGAAVIFLPLFVFLPRLIRFVTDADTDAVLAAFGRNEQVRKVFWALFIATAGLVLAQVVDPATAQKIVGIIMGIIP
jgi:hypothetical protein